MQPSQLSFYISKFEIHSHLSVSSFLNLESPPEYSRSPITAIVGAITDCLHLNIFRRIYLHFFIDCFCTTARAFGESKYCCGRCLKI
ncbi:hypothetical protein L2E82_49027 [Cichorium intybus]|uniref:Uncharacterized protein n=1 Tax=Cichorium intybus TaxID=13427 RepID=A0ACB8YZT7_CICIN|nr:hypothetical protein L2E82_49027 [Cichorium intybus]